MERAQLLGSWIWGSATFGGHQGPGEEGGRTQDTWTLRRGSTQEYALPMGAGNDLTEVSLPIFVRIRDDSFWVLLRHRAHEQMSNPGRCPWPGPRGSVRTAECSYFCISFTLIFYLFLFLFTDLREREERRERETLIRSSTHS